MSNPGSPTPPPSPPDTYSALRLGVATGLEVSRLHSEFQSDTGGLRR